MYKTPLSLTFISQFWFYARFGDMGSMVVKMALGEVFFKYSDFPYHYLSYQILNLCHVSSRAGAMGPFGA
jgi:hypothetical protein